MYTYIIETTKTRLTVYGHASAESAKRAVMKTELCPESAIISVKRVSFIIQGKSDDHWLGLNIDGYICSDEDSPRYATKQEARIAMKDWHEFWQGEGGAAPMRIMTIKEESI